MAANKHQHELRIDAVLLQLNGRKGYREIHAQENRVRVFVEVTNK